MATGGKKPHTSCRRGKRVRIKLRTGEVIVDVFLEGHDRFIVLKDRGKVMVHQIDSFGIYRGMT